jgi:hypothetical protein
MIAENALSRNRSRKAPRRLMPPPSTSGAWRRIRTCVRGQNQANLMCGNPHTEPKGRNPKGSHEI